jgi:hypothetical protein
MVAVVGARALWSNDESDPYALLEVFVRSAPGWMKDAPRVTGELVRAYGPFVDEGRELDRAGPSDVLGIWSCAACLTV